ncbi:MAG: D-alanyl-D-alanine carboxypeptidase family protein [Oscillospiraceae bacterium]|nr:D-alanyl-D-alanine carboxypeptidase family protein [Oscillospiraceae bacterium]
MKGKQRAVLLIACILALLTLAAVVAVLVLQSGTPYQQARNTMDPKGKLQLQDQENGWVLLSWPEGKNADGYLVEVLNTDTQESIHTAYAEGKTSCTVPQLPPNQKVTIRINSIGVYMDEGEEGMRIGDVPLEVTDIFNQPSVSGLEWSLDPDAHSLTFRFKLSAKAECVLFQQDENGTRTQMDTFPEESRTIVFGLNGECAMPEKDEVKTFALGAVVRETRYTYYGLVENTLSVEQDHLLGNTMMLSCRHEGQNIYTFTWNDTQADNYCLQQLTADQAGWVTLCTVPGNEKCSFTTQVLQRYTDYQFRVVAYYGDTMTENAYAAEPAKLRLTTGSSAIYSTVWPQRDISVYRDPQKSEVIGTAAGAQAFCVLDVENGLFKVRFGDGCGYIDSNYCMINLPEFMGGLCHYDITNSYSSIFTVHGYELPGITGYTVEGYESVCLYANDYLVPLLYPVAQKLEQAAHSAQKLGYRLKIYDAYRPSYATHRLYDLTAAVANWKLPGFTYDGSDGDFSGLTYLELMTNKGRYAMTAFLAKGGSRHNQGIAVDLTLESVETGEEIPMQTAMHDLSYFSVTGRNTETANVLRGIMTDAGFATLSTEWWHFQDDESRKSLGIDSYLLKGVSAACWMWDGQGWLYRCADGTYYINRTVTIEGISYSFDRDGHVI